MKHPHASSKTPTVPGIEPGLAPICCIPSANHCDMDLHASRNGKTHFNTITITSIGALAAVRLRRATHGAVLAVHRRSAYLQMHWPSVGAAHESLICLVTDEIGKGPLHVVIADNDLTTFGQLRPGMHVEWLASGVLTFGELTLCTEPPVMRYMSDVSQRADNSVLNQERAGATDTLALDTAGNEPTRIGWQSRLPAIYGQCVALRQWGKLPSESVFSACPTFGPTTLSKASIFDACDILFNWLLHHVFTAATAETESHGDQNSCDVHDLNQAVCLLLGAGIGLTPSGDDVLAGVFLALHRLDKRTAIEALWSVTEPLLVAYTHPISASLLHVAASTGAGNEATNALLDKLALSSPVTVNRGVIKQLDAIGSTSGWDMLAGIMLVTQAGTVDAATLMSKASASCPISTSVNADDPEALSTLTTRKIASLGDVHKSSLAPIHIPIE